MNYIWRDEMALQLKETEAMKIADLLKPPVFVRVSIIDNHKIPKKYNPKRLNKYSYGSGSRVIRFNDKPLGDTTFYVKEDGEYNPEDLGGRWKAKNTYINIYNYKKEFLFYINTKYVIKTEYKL